MGEAANQIMKLPPVPAREYGTLRVGRLTFLIKLVTSPCSETQGQVLRQVEQNIHESETDSFRDMKSVNIVLPWLAATGTLRKEFEKNKLGNIRLRAIPIEQR